MALNGLLRGAGKLVETAKTITRVKSPGDALSLALDKLIFGGGPASPTEATSRTSSRRGEPTAPSASIYASTPHSHRVVSTHTSSLATESRRQEGDAEEDGNNEDKDVDTDGEQEKQEIIELEHKEKTHEENNSSRVPMPPLTIEQAAANRQRRKEHITKSRREQELSSTASAYYTRSKEHGNVGLPADQRGDSVYGTDPSEFSYAYADAEQDENANPYAMYDPYHPDVAPRRNFFERLQFATATAFTPTCNVIEDDLEEYESDTEDASRAAYNGLKPIYPPANFNQESMPMREEHPRDDNSPRKIDVAQAFLDNLFSEKLNANTLHMGIQHSAPLSGFHLAYDYLSDSPDKARTNISLPRGVHAVTSTSPSAPSALRVISGDKLYNITIPPLNSRSVPPPDSVDRPRRNIRVNHGNAPYQRHRPSYKSDPFTPCYIPTTVIGSPNGNIPQVEWSTPMPIPNAEALSGSDDAVRDVEMMILDQLVERYYWDERAAAVWAENEIQREAIRQGNTSIKAMEIMNDFAANNPPNFIVRRLQELDDVLTPQIFQGSTHQSPLTTHLSQVGPPTLETEGTYHQVIQRYRDIYKGYRLFADQYKLPFRETVLDVDADVNMLGPH